MKKNYMFLAVIALLSILNSHSQVGVGTTNPEAALDVTSGTNGILVPRVALTSKSVSTPVVNSNGGGIPADGTLVWNTATSGTIPNNVLPGFYYWQGTAWREVGSTATGSLWALPGNAGTNPAANFVGTTDNQELRLRTSNIERLRIETDGDIGIGGAPNASAKLDIAATNRGLLIPRVALTAKNAAGPITGPVTSLLVYNTAAAGTFPQNVVPGFYYWTGTAWNEIGNISTNQWALLGNSGTTPAANFVGTTDSQDLRFKTNNLDRFNMGTNGQLTSFGTGSVNGPTYSWSGAGNANSGMFLPATSAVGFASNGTERFRIPNANQVHAMAGGTAALPFYSFNGNTGTGIWSSAANILNFSTSGSERMRLSNTSASLYTAAVDQSRLRVDCNALMPSFDAVAFYNTGGQGSNQWTFNAYQSTTDGGSIYGYCSSPTNNNMSLNGVNLGATGLGARGFHQHTTGAGIGVQGTSSSSNADGVVGTIPTTGAWLGLGGYFTGGLGYANGIYNLSDSRLKKEVRTISGALGKIRALRGVSYVHDGGKYPYLFEGDTKTYLGFIAQEVKEILPDAVAQKSIKTSGKAESEKMSDMASGREIMNVVDYTQVIPVLVEAVKEQQAVIDQLKLALEASKNQEASISELREELKALKAKLKD